MRGQLDGGYLVTSLSVLRDPYGHLEDKAALDQPTSTLLGVNAGAAAALQATGVDTILDLAQSQLFGNAVDICLLAELGEGRFAATGRIPSDVLRPPGDTPPRDLPAAPLEVLNWYGDVAQLHDLGTALDVATVRDLAAWPPYWTARDVFGRVFGPPEDGESSVGTPGDLLPSSGEFPTERVQYESLLFDGFVEGPAAGGHPIEGPVDVAALIPEEGYSRAALGGVLTFTQSWFTKALSLGNLIHSVALAPGESTKIAMIDWSRRTSAHAAEDITQGEDIISDTVRARAISEVTRAVARETQEGRSSASSKSFALEQGDSTGEAHLRDLNINPSTKAVGGVTSPGVSTSGTSQGSSRGESSSTGWSTTTGERDIAASLTQDVVDRTHQASHSVRSRRASIVREASQAEREEITTRTVTNYNHMHALTIEYYEVVQLYRMAVELTKAERCAFVPLKLLDFQDRRVVERYRAVLAASALTPAVAQILEYPPGTAQIRATSVDRGGLAPDTHDDIPGPKNQWWAQSVNMFRRQTGFDVQVTSDGRLVLPADAVWNQFSLNVYTGSGHLVGLAVTKTDGTTVALDGNGYTGEGVKLAEVASVAITTEGVAPEDSLALFIAGRYRGAYQLFPLVPLPAFKSGVTTAVLTCGVISPDALAHLVDHQLYYSQAVWRSLDPATIGIMLSQLTWPVAGQQRPLVELVDPTPAAVAANYLVLRLSGEGVEQHKKWLEEKNIRVGERREELVPIPSGGVFAEAVLGRSNSAERLEITRFWNWQDSPIPVSAPEIAPVQAGSRRDPDTTTPGQLGAPVVTVVSPPALPDPAGLGAVLTAIQNGSMFRDMSGLAATIGLSQAGLAGAQQAATAAATQAGHNAEVAAQLGAKVAELVADVAKAYINKMGTPGGGLASLTGGLTGQGAKIAQGQEMDKRDATGQPSGGSAHPPVPGSSNGARPASPGRPSGPSRRMDGTAAPPGSNEVAAFRAALGSADGGVDDGLFEQAASRVLGTGDAAAADSGEWVYWSQLITHTPSATLVADLHGRGLEILPLREAWGDVNLDYYPVRIAELPTVAGHLFSAQDLIQHVRAHIDDFVDTDNSSFPFLDPAIDGPTWSSDDPLGTVIDINVNVGGFLRMPPWEAFIDHSLVSCSGADDHRWIFTTMQGGPAAKHPVSGNRMFAVDEAGSDWILYTMGADRATSFLDWTVNAVGLIWKGADELWSGFQERVAEFVNDNGGEAEVATRHSRRYSWRVIERTLGLPPEVRL
jgi:hypothetical protein